jgi:hypothetical protein
VHNGKTLQSFGINPGGYLNIMDPKTGKWSQPDYGDTSAQLRKKAKTKVKGGRGYRRSHPAK